MFSPLIKLVQEVHHFATTFANKLRKVSVIWKELDSTFDKNLLKLRIDVDVLEGRFLKTKAANFCHPNLVGTLEGGHRVLTDAGVHS